MPRPCKRRRICEMPKAMIFTPKENLTPEGQIITMTLDEYETIRLIDLQSMTQESCAESMGVARTTVQAIYNNARKKIAQSICLGLELHIEGGDYILCEGRLQGCKCPRGQREDHAYENSCNL